LFTGDFHVACATRIGDVALRGVASMVCTAVPPPSHAEHRVCSSQKAVNLFGVMR
jgi:hypothetical protein